MAETKISVKNLPEFQRTLQQYVQYSKRDRTTIVNTKAYYIARSALYWTAKAKKSDVRRWFTRATQAIIGKIINKRRGERGEKGLYGEAMRQAQIEMRAKRLRAIAFLKSGWIPAIRRLEPLAERPGSARRIDPDALGKPGAQGSASPASGLLFTKAIIRNAAEARHSTTHDPLGKFGIPGLEKAVAEETKSMQGYIERKLRQRARALGIKTN